MQIASIALFIIPLMTLPLLFSCEAAYKGYIADPSERTEIECISMVVPSDGNWRYSRNTYYQPGWDCSLLGSGGLLNRSEEDIYQIWIVFLEAPFRNMSADWDDELDNEYILNKAKKYIEAQKKDYMGNKKIGMDYFNYEGVKLGTEQMG